MFVWFLVSLVALSTTGFFTGVISVYLAMQDKETLIATGWRCGHSKLIHCHFFAANGHAPYPPPPVNENSLLPFTTATWAIPAVLTTAILFVTVVLILQLSFFHIYLGKLSYCFSVPVYFPGITKQSTYSYIIGKRNKQKKQLAKLPKASPPPKPKSKAQQSKWITF